MKTNKSFSVGIVLALLSVMLVAMPTPVGAPSNIVYIEFHPKPFASFMIDSVEYLIWATVVNSSPYGTGNMVMIYKNVSVNAYNFSIYVASENLLLGEKYGWLTSLVYPACIPEYNMTLEGVQSASITIEETATNLIATVSGPISLSITYTPYGDNSTIIEDPGDNSQLYDYDGDGFFSNSIRRACTANGSFNGHQLGPTNLNWGNFDTTDYEWYDLGKLSPVGSISILSPQNKTYAVKDVSLTFTVSESTSWMGYSLDGQANVTITGNTTLSGLSDGSHSLIVYAKNIAGSTGASETIYFTIETKKEEAFPTWIIAAIVIIAIVGVTLLVYFTKVKKTTEKVD